MMHQGTYKVHSAKDLHLCACCEFYAVCPSGMRQTALASDSSLYQDAHVFPIKQLEIFTIFCALPLSFCPN